MDAVVSHYNALEPVEDRASSAIADLRVVNNYVKTCLIGETPSLEGCTVLDLCAGKGGDLGKWARRGIGHLTLADAAQRSLDEARKRYDGMQPIDMGADFVCTDAFGQMDGITRVYDVVSCQFALHYAFETEALARQTLRNVSRVLKRRGPFLITVPNADRILREAGMLNWGYHKIERKEGTRYTFTLPEAVGGVDEYLVPHDVLIRLANEEGLDLRMHASFTAYMGAKRRQPETRALWARMTRGVKEITSHALVTAALYDVYIFVKR
jgi:mRNA (guanine-N7-)-methyltransferase